MPARPESPSLCSPFPSPCCSSSIWRRPGAAGKRAMFDAFAARPPGRIGEGAATEPAGGRAALIGLTVAILALFMLLPLIVVFWQALSKGFGAYFAAFADPDAQA